MLLGLNGEQNHIDESITDNERIQINISGNNNRILWKDPEILGGGQIRISIEGNNNEIVFHGQIIIDSLLLIYIVDHDHVLNIGKNCSFVFTTISFADEGNNVIIGNDCMFSNGITLMTSDFHSIIDMQTNNRINWGKDIIIGNHVWLGMDVMVLKGARIGSNSVIGARSVISSMIDPCCIACGTPAKIVRHNINWERERRKKELPIWDPRESRDVFPGDFEYNLEGFDPSLEDRSLEGWIFIRDMDNAGKEGWMEIVSEEGESFIICLHLYDREDVKQYFQNPYYLFSGFRGYIPQEVSRIKKIKVFLKIRDKIYTKVVLET